MAAAVPAPVTPEVVRWAVEEDGRRLSVLADAVKVDEDTLAAWVEGDARPSTGQVTRLAKALRRQRALFFLPSAPESATLPTGFRHPPGATRDVSQAARLEVRRARHVQDAVSWALRERGPVELPHYDLRQEPGRVGEQVRAWTGVTVDEQVQWKAGPYAALNEWRDRLEQLGVLVFSIEIGRDEVRGFSSWDPWAPLIALNVSSVAPPARVFTLAHELGHLVTRTDSACVEPQRLLVDVDVERWCERFAASLLMPASDFRRLARLRRLGLREADLSDVDALMKHFHVSARAAALRMIDLDYAPPSFYAQVEAVYRPKATAPTDKERRGSAPRDVQRLREYGPTALREVLNGLPEATALRVLRLTVEDARKLAERVPGVHAAL